MTHPVQVQGGVHKRNQLVKAVQILLRVVLCCIEQQRVLQAVVCIQLVVERAGLAICVLIQAAAAAEGSCNVLEPEPEKQQQTVLMCDVLPCEDQGLCAHKCHAMPEHSAAS